MILAWLLLAVVVAAILLLVFLLMQPRGSRPTQLWLAVPTVKPPKGNLMADYQIQNDNVAFVPIVYLDANGNPTQGPSGDTLSVASSDTVSLGAVIGTMPSGPLQGAACAVLTPLVLGPVTGITVTASDSAGLTPSVIQVDIIGGVAVALSLEVADAVTQPQTPPAQAKKA